MALFVFFLYFLMTWTTYCNGLPMSSNLCGHSSGKKYKLYQYGTNAVGTKNYHLVTTSITTEFPHSELLGSVLSETDNSCNCLLEAVTVHKDVTSWFGYARNIDNLLITNDTVPASYSITNNRFVCAREENACGASLALRIFYNQVNDDHFYVTKNDTGPKNPRKDPLEKQQLGILCYIWPASEASSDTPPPVKPPATTQRSKETTKAATTKATTKAATTKATTKAATTKATTKPATTKTATIKAATTEAKGVPHQLNLLPIVSLGPSVGSSIRPIVSTIKMETIAPSQMMQPAISVVWDHSKTLSTMERAVLYIGWYNASIEYINSVSNGTPDDYRRFMPYYPGPPIFDDGHSYPSNPSTLHPAATSVGHQAQTTKAAVSKSSPMSTTNSHRIIGPSPMPALNVSTEAILAQLAHMNLTLDEFKVAYESWLHNTSIWLAWYYGQERAMPNGTVIQKQSSTPAPSLHGHSPLDTERVNNAYNDWLNGTKVIIGNLLTENGHFGSYINSQPNKSIAHEMLNHIQNPPPVQLLTRWPGVSSSPSFNGNITQVHVAYEKWFKEANRLTEQMTNGQNLSDPRDHNRNNNGPLESALSGDSDKQWIDTDMDKLVKAAIPQLLAESKNGTDFKAFEAAYQKWLEQNQKTHTTLAHYKKEKENNRQ